KSIQEFGTMVMGIRVGFVMKVLMDPYREQAQDSIDPVLEAGFNKVAIKGYGGLAISPRIRRIRLAQADISLLDGIMSAVETAANLPAQLPIHGSKACHYDPL